MTIKDNSESNVVGVRLSNNEVLKIDQLANDDGRSRSSYIRKIIIDHLKEVSA